MLPSGIIRGYRHILLFIWHISAQQSFPLFTCKPEFFEAEPHFIRKVTRNTQLEVSVRVNVKLAISPRQSAQDPVANESATMLTPVTDNRSSRTMSLPSVSFSSQEYVTFFEIMFFFDTKFISRKS